MDGGSPVQPGKPAPGVFVIGPKQILTRRVQSGANWFLWIAGLSLVNSISALTGSHFRFIMGLRLTQITDQLAGGSANAAALVFDLVAAGVFVGFWLLAKKGRDWAFIAGMILYGLDALLFVLGKDLMSIAFHLLALYSISIAFHLLALYYLYRGLKANEALTKLGGAAGA
jgi:hypothetical protein